MYERSAIVLERYFNNLLGYDKTNNIRQNLKNYCDLFEKFNLLQTANSEEFSAIEEFQAAENEIEEIQNAEEKLYKKNAKLQYSRDLIFADISQKPEEIEKCITKIEGDVSKNQESYIKLRERFVAAVRNYNEKKSTLAKCKKARKNAENEYNAVFELTKLNIENIEPEYIEVGKEFVTDENKEALISTMANNGKDEKIPFNNAVITAATNLGFSIYEKEEECYLEAHKMANKLIKELLDGAVSVEAHTKTIRNINVKINFFNAEKDYLVQFLDYERVTVIYGKRSHRTLMQEACEKFDTDINQINNLYQLLLKEIANKSTKKAYRELYNKSYLIDMEEKNAKFKKEKNRMNMPVGTIMNSNYWRIEGIKNIYNVFYKDVTTVFGKDLDELDMPQEQENTEVAETVEVDKKNEKVEAIEVDTTQENKIVKVEDNKVKKAKRYTRKVVEATKDVAPLNETVTVETEPKTESVAENVEKTIKEEASVAIVEERPQEETDTTEVSSKEEVAVVIEEKETKKEKKAKTTKSKAGKAKEEKTEKKEKKTRKKEKEQEENIAAAVTEESEDNDIFGEKYKDIDDKIAALDLLDDVEETKIQEELASKLQGITKKPSKKAEKILKSVTEKNEDEQPKESMVNIEESIKETDLDEDTPYDDEESIFESISSDDDDSVVDFAEIGKARVKTKTKKKMQKAPKKASMFENLIKFNSKEKKTAVK